MSSRCVAVDGVLLELFLLLVGSVARQDDAAVEFCGEMQLPVYPSFAFFGRGTFHAHDPVSDFLTRSNRAVHPSSVMVSVPVVRFGFLDDQA